MNWLQEHLDEYEPGCSIETTTHVCDICAPYLDAARPRREIAKYMTTDEVRGKGYSRIVGNFGAKPNEFDPLNPVSLCGMWIAPDYMADCDIWPEEASEEAIRVSIAYASEVLNKLIGMQIRGVCELTVHPGSLCADHQRWSNLEIDSPPGRFYSDKLNSVGVGGSCNCDQCKSWFRDCSDNELRLPGPIQAIGEVVINGEVLSKDSYYIRDSRTLVRTDGQPWPQGNNCMSRSPYKVWPPRVVDCETIYPADEIDWKTRYLKDASIVPARELFDLEHIANLGCAPEWAVDFLAANPLAFEDLNGEHWVDEFLRHNGIKACKVDGDLISKDQWILAPAQAAQIKQSTTGCVKCNNSKRFGHSCGECGAVDAIIYNPKAGNANDLPDWLEAWADNTGTKIVAKPQHWLEIAADLCNFEVSPEEVAAFPANILTMCDNPRCHGNPKNIKLEHLNHGRVRHDVTGLKIVGCCKKQGNMFLDALIPIVNGCDYDSFKMILETSTQQLAAPEEVDLNEISIECLASAPLWARPWLNPEYEEVDVDMADVEITNTDKLPSWLSGALQPSAPAAVEEFFIDFIEKNSTLDIANKPKSDRAEPPSLHRWSDDEDYIEENPVDDGTVSWAIRYYAGEVPSEGAKLAVAFLAKEIVTSLCGQNTCFTSRHLSRLTIDQAADFRWPDIFKSLEKGLTGIMEIDLFIKSCNPAGLRKTGYGFSGAKYAASRKVHRVRRP